LSGQMFAGLVVAQADDFSYRDPVDQSLTERQGIRILFEGGGRVVFRLSGTGTQGATLRVYLERSEPADGRLDKLTGDALADLIHAADAIARVCERTGRDRPTVIT